MVASWVSQPLSPFPLGCTGTSSDVAHSSRGRMDIQPLRLTVCSSTQTHASEPEAVCAQEHIPFCRPSSALSILGLSSFWMFFHDLSLVWFQSCLGFYTKPCNTSLTGIFTSMVISTSPQITKVIAVQLFPYFFILRPHSRLILVCSNFLPSNDSRHVVATHIPVKSACSQVLEPLSSHLLSPVSSY